MIFRDDIVPTRLQAELHQSTIHQEIFVPCGCRSIAFVSPFFWSEFVERTLSDTWDCKSDNAVGKLVLSVQPIKVELETDLFL